VSIRVVVAEDSLLVREGIQKLLEAQPDIEVVALVGDLPALLEAVEANPPDVVMTDIRMPPTGTDEGIRAANQLRETHPDLGVVVLSQYADPSYALALLEAGSERRAYLLKERVSDPDQIMTAIRDVARGGSVIDPKVVEVLVEERTRAERSPLNQLTARELEVLAEIATGKSNSAIADSLVLTKRAVEKHVGAIFLKLGLPGEDLVSRRVAAVLLYLASERS